MHYDKGNCRIEVTCKGEFQNKTDPSSTKKVSTKSSPMEIDHDDITKKKSLFLLLVKRIIAIALSLVFLTSSIGFTVNTHTCYGSVVEQGFSLGMVRLDCGMAMAEAACGTPTSSDRQSLDARSCCKNEAQRFELGSEFEPSAGINLLQLSLLIAVLPDHLTGKSSIAPPPLLNWEEGPPIPKNSPQIRFQTFLI